MATDGKHSPAWLLDAGGALAFLPLTRSAATTRDLASPPARPGGHGLKEDALCVAPEPSGWGKGR